MCQGMRVGPALIAGQAMRSKPSMRPIQRFGFRRSQPLTEFRCGAPMGRSIALEEAGNSGYVG